MHWKKLNNIKMNLNKIFEFGRYGRIISTMSLFILTASFIKAQEINTYLSLEQAREYALKYNKILRNANENIMVSEEKIKEVRAQGLPQVNGTLDFMTYFNYELEFKFGFGGDAIPDLNIGLLDEGDFEILRYLGNLFGSTSAEPIIMNNQSSAKVQLSQLIFSGQYLIGLQTVKLAKDLAVQSFKKSEIEVIESISNSYYLILATEHTLEILDKTLENMNVTLQHTKNLYTAGVAEETDVDQIHSAVSQLKNNKKSLERMIQLNYNMLKFQLGVKPDQEIKLTDKLDNFLNILESEDNLLAKKDLNRNIDYQLMEMQVQLAEKQLDMTKWSYGPSISGFYSYTEKIVTTSFDLTPKHIAGVNMSLPIFSSGMKKAQLSQAKIELNMSQRNKELVKEQLELQEKQFMFNLQNALENYETQKENILIAERLYNSIRNKYTQGLLSSLDLVQANSNYLNAENNYLNSILTLLQARLSIEKLYNLF